MGPDMTSDGGMVGSDSGTEDGGTTPDEDGGVVEDGGSDACAGVTCVNGTCAPATGVCVCDTGWDGDTCEDPVLLDTDGMVLWLDATDEETLTFDGVNATEWTDKGPAHHNFRAAGSDNGPSLSTIGSRAALRFDGIDDAMSAGGFSALGGELSYTMFLVVSARANNQVLNGYAIGGHERIRLRDTAWGMTYTHRVPAGASATFSLDEAYRHDQVHIVTIQRTHEDTSIWIDGGFRIAVPTSYPEALPTGDLTLTLGDDLETDEAEPLNGLVGEVLAYDSALDFETRERVERYLAARWLETEPHHDPSSLGNAVLWLDAAHDESFALTGDSVASWTSRVGGQVFDNATADYRPTRVAEGMNGLPVVRFDGVDDNLSAEDLNILDDQEEYTVAVVAHPAATSGHGLFYGVQGTTPGFNVGVSENDARITHRGPPAITGGDVALVTLESAGATFGEAVRFIGWRSGPRLWAEAAFESGSGTQDITDVTQSTLPVLTFVVGGTRPDHTIDQFEGDVAEIVVFQRSLTTAERTRLAEMLDEKWGL